MLDTHCSENKPVYLSRRRSFSDSSTTSGLKETFEHIQRSNNVIPIKGDISIRYYHCEALEICQTYLRRNSTFSSVKDSDLFKTSIHKIFELAEFKKAILDQKINKRKKHTLYNIELFEMNSKNKTNRFVNCSRLRRGDIKELFPSTNKPTTYKLNKYEKIKFDLLSDFFDYSDAHEASINLIVIFTSLLREEDRNLFAYNYKSILQT
ncbi:hypothetical protein [Marinomonas mediterranea]|uniref:Uncharacterized protein n=1 Tax=Marinomonas mediterranea (strain ATCC 700492 / JCM 21426 / NBRC 103028 / MMB-1) TaxID=717774 RepID=F2JW07_MARM1|nr:hypothetical protein [Marinomonas mediterranea]ADZ92895.1 hypothetical protein Marme_3684 [Marinomonas mediterranea MMB-1]WCN18916.1 hypothetical protein GV053_18655 [Marinomonas mediterranea MMB-1]